MYQRPCRLTIADKYYGGTPDIPEIRPAEVFAAIRQNLGPIVQKQFGLAREFGPKFAAQDIKNTQEFAPQYAQTGYDISKQFAPQYQELNLGQMQRAIAGQPLLGALNTQAQAGLKSQGVDPLLGQLTGQAQERLAQRGQLTPQEAYQATQSSITPFAGRGNVFGQAQAAAFLNRDALVRQRQQEAQQFAGNVEAQRQSGLQQAQSFGLGTQAANLQGLAGTGGLVNTPNLAAYAAPGASYTPMTTGIGATSGTLGTVTPVVSEIFSANQNAAANQAIGGANKTSGIAGGALSAVGSIAAAY